MNLTDILALLTALGGFEAVKWLAGTLINRKTNKRKEEAAALDLERSSERDHINYLETRLLQRDEKIDAIYHELRKEQAEKIKVIYEKHAVELELKEAGAKRCDVRGCKERRPPSDY